MHMANVRHVGKTVLLLGIGIVIVYFVSFFALTAYATLFHSHQSFADAFPLEKADLGPGAVLVNISDSDLAEYPLIRELLENPSGGHVTFDRIHYRDQQQIEDFRNKYGVNRSVNRYVQWNGTYYQIVVGQE